MLVYAATLNLLLSAWSSWAVVENVPGNRAGEDVSCWSCNDIVDKSAHETVELDLFGYSSEGGHVVYYLEDSSISCIEATLYGAAGKSRVVYVALVSALFECRDVELYSGSIGVGVDVKISSRKITKTYRGPAGRHGADSGFYGVLMGEFQANSTLRTQGSL